MTEFYPVLKRFVDGLTDNTAAARRTIYEKARTVLLERLRGQRPALPEKDITRERLALEEAVRRIEAEAARRLRDPLARLIGQDEQMYKDYADAAVRATCLASSLDHMKKDACGAEARGASSVTTAPGKTGTSTD